MQIKNRTNRRRSITTAKPSEESKEQKPSRRIGRRLWILVSLLVALIVVAFVFRDDMANELAKSAGDFDLVYDRERAESLLDYASIISQKIPQIALAKAKWARRDGDLLAWNSFTDQARRLSATEQDLYLEESLMAAQQTPTANSDKRLISLLEQYGSSRDDICYAYALGYLGHARYESAMMLLTAWSDEADTSAMPLALMGTAYAEQQNYENAESYYRKSLRLDPRQPIANLGLAELLLTNGRTEESLTYFEAAAQTGFSGTVAALVGWASALRSLGRSGEAIQVLNHPMAVSTHDPSLQMERAYLAIEAGQFELAAKLLKPEIDSGSRQQSLNYAYATAQRRLGNREVAQKHFELASEAAQEASTVLKLTAQLIEQPQDTGLKFEIGWRHLKYGDPQEGLRWLAQVLTDDPDHHGSRQAIAEYYQRRSQVEQ